MIVMESIWEKLAQQEEEWQQSGASEEYGQGSDDEYGEDFLTGYVEDEYELAQSEEEPDFDYGDGGDDDKEFTHFIDQDPEEFGFSYGQLEQIGHGDIDFGTTIGGKFSKLEKIVQMQTVSKEKLYTNKLKVDLNLFFSFAQTNHYAEQVQQVPRFWLKNSHAMAGTIFMINKLSGVKPTTASLAEYSKQTNVRSEDLFRYYRLLENYIN